MLAASPGRALPFSPDGTGLLPFPTQAERLSQNGSPTLPTDASHKQYQIRRHRATRPKQQSAPSLTSDKSPKVNPKKSSQESSSRRKASQSSRNDRNPHTNLNGFSMELSPLPDSSIAHAYNETMTEDDATPIAKLSNLAEVRPGATLSDNAVQMAASIHEHNLLFKQMEDSICPLTPVEMDLGALAMIASLSNITTPILTNKINASANGGLATPQSGLRLKSGSVIAMITPEQSCWSRAPYIAGDIMMSYDFLLPTTMMTDMDQLACFIGVATSFEARVKSDDAILDDIVDFFGDMGLMDVEPFVRPMHLDLPPPMVIADSQESPEIPEIEETGEAEEAEASDLGSDRWSGSTGWSAARTTLSSIDEIARGDLGKDEALSDVPNTPGSRSSNASSLSNAWVQRQFPTFTDDLAKHRISGQSTLPDTWTNRHSLPASERSLPSPRHPGSVGSERKSGARKAAPLKKGGKISIRRILASAGSIV